MDKVVVNSYEDFEKLLGRQIGISDYVEVSQDRINLFADATLDHQWIHVDTERAKVESPYHSTICTWLPDPFVASTYVEPDYRSE